MTWVATEWRKWSHAITAAAGRPSQSDEGVDLALVQPGRAGGREQLTRREQSGPTGLVPDHFAAAAQVGSGAAPPPVEAVILSEPVEHLIRDVSAHEHPILGSSLQGYTVPEVSARLGISNDG